MVGCNIGFSLFERAWTLRGMENLLIDMVEAPAFVDDLLDAITEYNLAVIEGACRFPIDFMMFGDDWGQQLGLLMGPAKWRRFIKPRLARMYGAVRASGRYVLIHSCGKVDELFPDLIEIGLNCFLYKHEAKLQASYGLFDWTDNLAPGETRTPIRAEHQIIVSTQLSF